MSRKVLNRSNGRIQLWSMSFPERLTLNPGVNTVDESLFARFASQVSSNTNLLELNEINDIPAPKVEKLQEVVPKEPIEVPKELDIVIDVPGEGPVVIDIPTQDEKSAALRDKLEKMKTPAPEVESKSSKKRKNVLKGLDLMNEVV